MKKANTIRDRIKELRRVRAGDLHASPRNWRTHPKAQVDALQGVLREIGYADALLARELPDGTLELVDGHARKELDPDQVVPVLILDIDQDEALKLMTVLDPLAAMAEADSAALETLLGEIQTDEAALQAMIDGLAKEHGIERDEQPQADPEPQIDRAAELHKEWGTAAGQVWTIPGKAGVHRVLCGDSTKAEDVGRLMDGKKGHCIFTDPPYGVAYDGGIKKRESLANDEVGTEIYAKALPLLSEAVDDQSPLYLWYADGHAAAAAAAAAAAGYQITAQIIWAKNHAQFVTSAHYKGKHEPCYYAHKKNKCARWHGPNNEVTLWEYDRAQSNDFHPTQKPVALATRAITNSTEAGQIILDGFLGGGTTLIAAENLSRVCYGMEISAAYVAVILQRAKDAGMEPALESTLTAKPKRKPKALAP